MPARDFGPSEARCGPGAAVGRSSIRRNIVIYFVCRGAAAAVFAMLCIAPAVAQTREPVQVHVSSAGLDLANPRDRTILGERIRIAADQACVSMATGLVRERDEQQCHAEMLRDGATQIAAIAARSGVEVAAIQR
nr:MULTISPECIES: UrcA family protein [unclassified Sphingomonas]